MIPIAAGFVLREDELSFTFDRASGPGGQNVNKVNTRVTLWFDVRHASSLSADQRERLLRVLANRMDRDGRLRIVCQTHRSQIANRQEAVARLVDLLRRALKPRKVRRPTRATAASRERRLAGKAHRSSIKRQRRPRPDD